LAIASSNSTPSIVAINQVPTSVTEYTKATQNEVINSFQKRDVCSGGYSSKGVDSNDESKPAEFIKLNKFSLSSFSIINSVEAGILDNAGVFSG
jgi:hypothetical protein